jgi:hypothetical protein
MHWQVSSQRGSRHWCGHFHSRKDGRRAVRCFSGGKPGLRLTPQIYSLMRGSKFSAGGGEIHPQPRPTKYLRTASGGGLQHVFMGIYPVVH